MQKVRANRRRGSHVQALALKQTNPRLRLSRAREWNITTCESSLTLSLKVGTALRLCLKLGPDVVEEVVQALGLAHLGTPHNAGRVAVLIHGCGKCACSVSGAVRAVRGTLRSRDGAASSRCGLRRPC